MKSHEWYIFDVAEGRQKLLIPKKGFIELDEVHCDFAWMKKGERNVGWVDTTQVKSNQKISAWMNFHRMNLK